MNTERAPVSPHLPVRPDWLARHTEAALEPGLPIIDAHHHLWDHPGNRYLHAEVLADVGAGHNIVATAYMECSANYRTDGPPELMSLGETEYVNKVAEASASGAHGRIGGARRAAAPHQLCGLRPTSVAAAAWVCMTHRGGKGVQ